MKSSDKKTICSENEHDKKLGKLLSGMKPVKAPRDFDARLKSRIEQSGKNRLSKILFYPRHIKIPLEAAAVLVIGLTLFIKSDYMAEVVPGGEQAAYTKESDADGSAVSRSHAKPVAKKGSAAPAKSVQPAERRAISDERELSLAKEKADRDDDAFVDVEVIVASRSVMREEAAPLPAAAGASIDSERTYAKTEDKIALADSKKSAVNAEAQSPMQKAKAAKKSPRPVSSDIEVAAKDAGGSVQSNQGNTYNVQIRGSQMSKFRKDLSNIGTVREKQSQKKDQIQLEVAPRE